MPTGNFNEMCINMWNRQKYMHIKSLQIVERWTGRGDTRYVQD